MKIKIAAIIVLLLGSAVLAADKTDKPKSLYKVVRLSVAEAIFACQDGQKPIIKSIADSAIIIGCQQY